MPLNKIWRIVNSNTVSDDKHEVHKFRWLHNGILFPVFHGGIFLLYVVDIIDAIRGTQSRNQIWFGRAYEIIVIE